MKQFVLFLAVGLTAASSGCSPSPKHFSRVPLPMMTAITCKLKVVQEGALNPEYQRGTAGTVMDLTIVNLNEQAGTARVIGNMGTAEVKFSRELDQLQFLERTPIGNLTLLTVYSPPEPGASLPAAYSRHILVSPANVAISQYAGSCQPKV